MKKLFSLLFLIALFLTSCDITNGGSEESKVFLSNLECIKQNGVYLVYKDNKLFTGTAWSSDGTTANIECTQGEITKSNFYYPNGKVAVLLDLKPGQQVCNTTTNKTYSLYNDQGAPLVIFCRNTESSNAANFAYYNIDKTSTSYGSHGYWESSTLPYPYQDWEQIIKRGEAIIEAELPMKK